jgi:hypothetical protein
MTFFAVASISMGMVAWEFSEAMSLLEQRAAIYNQSRIPLNSTSLVPIVGATE